MAEKYNSLLPNEDRSLNDPTKRSKMAAIQANLLQNDIDTGNPKAAKAAADARANRKEAEAEGQRYAKGGSVKSFKGYGKARKV